MTDPASPPLDDEDVTTRRIERLLDLENAAWLQLLVSSLPPGDVTRLYRDAFVGKSEHLGRVLVRRPLKDVRSEHVLEALEKLREHQPALLRRFVLTWLARHDDDLNAMQRHEAPDVAADVLDVASWLLSAEGRADDRAALQHARSQVRALTIELHEQQRVARDATLAHERLSNEHGKLTRRLEQLQARHAQQSQEERNALVRKHDRELLRLRTAAQRAQDDIDAARGHLDAVRAQHERDARLAEARWAQERDALQRRVDALEAQRNAESHALVSEARAQLRRERFEFEEQQQALRRQLREQHERVVDLEGQLAERAEPTLDAQLLDDALIVNYPALHDEPIERFVGLFDAYRAFLAQRHDDATLSRASNIAAFSHRAPRGLLVVGLERLLEDGANLPLARYLRMSVFRQEAVLQRLIDAVESPRLPRSS